MTFFKLSLGGPLDVMPTLNRWAAELRRKRLLALDKDTFSVEKGYQLVYDGQYWRPIPAPKLYTVETATLTSGSSIKFGEIEVDIIDNPFTTPFVKLTGVITWSQSGSSGNLGGSRFIKDGTVLGSNYAWDLDSLTGANGQNITTSISLVDDNPTPGSHTYRADLIRNSAGTMYATFRTLIVEVCYRLKD